MAKVKRKKIEKGEDENWKTRKAKNEKPVQQKNNKVKG